MATITFKGSDIQTAGTLPAEGTPLPDFTLAAGDLSDKSLADYAGKVKILSIVPSLDTPVCATSAETLHKKLAGKENVVFLNISADLPFAAGRFCQSQNLDHVETLSTFRSPEFGTDYGVVITDSPLRGILSRAVLVADEENRVLYSQQVPEIAEEPDYDAVIAALPSA